MAYCRNANRGRQSPEAEAEYREQVAAFCALIQQIQSTMDFAVGSRGWCYILERHGLRKGDFDAAQKLITECRKSGDLPLDICAEDASRETIGLEQLDSNDIPGEVESWVDHLRNHAHEQLHADQLLGRSRCLRRGREPRSSTCAICSSRCVRSFTSRSQTSKAGAISTAAPR